jgi:hypothetical protein
MRQIIQSSMQSITAPEGEEEYQPREATSSRKAAQKERPPLTSFMR